MQKELRQLLEDSKTANLLLYENDPGAVVIRENAIFLPGDHADELIAELKAYGIVVREQKHYFCG